MGAEMIFKPVRTKKIYEEIIDQIKKLITEGELKPGDRLIPERELADQLQVGRSAVREAFRALEAMGIIEIRAGEGAFIRGINHDSLVEILGLVLLTEKDTARELMELRKIMEVEAAALAAVRRDKDDLANLKKFLRQMEKDIEAGDLGEESDMYFHTYVAVATHNSLLSHLMGSISETMRKVLKTARQKLYETPGMPKRLLQEHIDIYNAIEKGSAQEARKAMFNHLDKVEKAMFP